MNKAQVRDLLFTALTPVITAKGFRLNKKDWRFFRVIPGGNQTIGIPCTGAEPQFKFTLVLNVRLDAVEQIRNLFNEAPPAYHAATKTFVGRLDRFFAQEPFLDESFRFSVANEADVQSALAQLLPVVQNTILPFLDRQQDIPSIASAMNLTAAPPTVTNLNEASAPLTVARLSRHPGFDALVNGYRQALQGLGEPEKHKFEQLVVHLQKI